jgi:hypothetical protein
MGTTRLQGEIGAKSGTKVSGFHSPDPKSPGCKAVPCKRPPSFAGVVVRDDVREAGVPMEQAAVSHGLYLGEPVSG